MSRIRACLPLMAGLALTAAAILLARQRITAIERGIREKASPIDVVVASAPIKAGTLFSRENLAKMPLPASGTSRRNVPAAESELLMGAAAKSDLAAGEPVLWTDVEEPFEAETFSETIPPGRRAVTLAADASASFAGLLRPGDKVDLLCEPSEGTAPGTWMRNIPVISVDKQFNRPPTAEDGTEAATITLSVTPEEGRRLAVVASHGRIRWFLRNPSDNTVPISAAMSGRPRLDVVELWHAGLRVIPATVSWRERPLEAP